MIDILFSKKYLLVAINDIVGPTTTPLQFIYYLTLTFSPSMTLVHIPLLVKDVLE
jgi:hypothetical protein